MDLLSPESFDAALVPGFRAAVKPFYRDLTAVEQARAAQLRSTGRFHPRDCPICAAPAAGAAPLPHFSDDRLRLLRCQACRMVYSHTVLVACEDRARYGQPAAALGEADDVPGAFATLKRQEAYARLEAGKQAYVVQRVAALGAAPGRMLDIGCANGSALDAFAAAGWRVAGVEPTPGFAAATRARHPEVHTGFFPEAAPPGHFDLVTLFDLLEHIEAPLPFLAAIRARLAPGGVLAVQVPNFDSPLVQIEGARSTVVTFGHWSYFDPPSLRACLERAGFLTIGLESYVSELDRMLKHPEAVLRAALGPWAPARLADLRPADLFARQLGFKLFGLFRRAG